MYAGERLIDSDGYEVCLYPFVRIGITAYPDALNHTCDNIANTGLYDQGYGAPYGPSTTPIYAPFSGTITVAMTGSGQGNTRILSSSNMVRLGNGNHSYASFMWGHDNQLLVNLGDSVTQGQLIGYTGNKDTTAYHCHMGLYVGRWQYGNYIPTCHNSPYNISIYYMPSPPNSLGSFFYGNDTTNYESYGLPLYQGGSPSTQVSITASVSPSGAGSVSGTGTYNIGDSVSLTAIAYSGHIFRQWSTGQTTATINFTASENRLYIAYFDDAPIPPTPIEPEEKILTVVPTHKDIFIPKDNASFRLDVTISGTPLNSEWNWYPDYSIAGDGITLSAITGTSSNPWIYSQYTGQDGNTYVLTTGSFNVNLEWLKRLRGTSGTYTITFTRYNNSWTVYDLTQTVTINYEYEKGDVVMFLQYDGGTVDIR